MLGFHLDGWDYATFAALAVVGLSVLISLVWLAGLPGRIAIARKHPDAEAVSMLGWAGFLAAVPWIQAFIWAFKPTDIVDIRRFPPEERVATDEMIARLRGTAAPGKASPGDPQPDASPSGVKATSSSDDDDGQR